MPSDPAFSRAGQQGSTPQEPPVEPVEEPRTETTLTTRISINIPGSRPIPPVVVRSPMPGAAADRHPESQDRQDPPPAGPRHRSGTGSSPVIGVMDSANGNGAMPEIPPEWRTAGQGAPISPAATGAPAADDSDAPSTWFAPRKKDQAPAATPEPAPAPAPAPAPLAQPPYERQQPVFDRPPFEPAPFEPPGFEQPRYEPPGYEPQPPEPQGFGQPVYQQQPYGAPEPQGQDRPRIQPPDPIATTRPGGGARPTGMNSGLIVGGPETPVTPAAAPVAPAAPAALDALDALDTTIPLAVVRDPSLQAQYQAQQAQQQAPPLGRPPTPAPAPAAPRAPRAPRPSPRGGPAARSKGGAPARPNPAAAPTSAPVPVPSLVGDGFAGGTGGVGAPPRKENSGEAQASAGPAATAKAKPRTKSKAAARSRKLLVTGVSLLVLVAGVTYGAGLMLNQADVPKGTTVLGQNIGGDTRDAAVHALDGTVGVLAAKPLQLVVGGRNVMLQTSVAGLSIDTTATVQGVAHHSYNPVGVVGSLLGGDHPVAPTVRIDRDKLRSALQNLAGSGSGGAREGSVSFTAAGDVVTTLPKAGSALDVNGSIDLVEHAYQERAAGLPDRPITLPVTTSAPKSTAAEVNAAAKGLGQYAATNKFTVRIHGVSQPFGKLTFSQALTLRPDATGKLVPVFDLAKLAGVYGSTFDHVKIKHNGVSGPVTPQDIATALTRLLTKADGDSLSVTLT